MPSHRPQLESHGAETNSPGTGILKVDRQSYEAFCHWLDEELARLEARWAPRIEARWAHGAAPQATRGRHTWRRKPK